jgi:phage gpG-like protein
VITISVRLDGALVVDRKLEAIGERAQNLMPAYPGVIQVFREIARQAFGTEGASTASGAWAQLKPATIKDRERKGFPGAHPILQRTQRLMRSLTDETGDTINVETPTYLGIGSATPYVAYHQSTAPRTRLPRRAIIDLTDDQKSQLFLPLRRYVTGYDPNAPIRGRIG